DGVDEGAERVVGVGPVLRPLLPELATDDDVGDVRQRPTHQLALIRTKGAELEAIRRLDDAVDGREEVGGGPAGHGQPYLSSAWVSHPCRRPGSTKLIGDTRRLPHRSVV